MKGILDAESPTNFDLGLSSLESKWDEFEYSVHPQRDPQVYEWILENEVYVMKASVIHQSGCWCGLTSCSVHHISNESMNKVAELHADYC